MRVEQSRSSHLTGDPARSESLWAAAVRAILQCLLHLPLFAGLGIAGCNEVNSDAKADVLPGELEEDFWFWGDVSYAFEKKLCECGDPSCLSRLSEARWEVEMRCLHEGALKYPQHLRDFF